MHVLVSLLVGSYMRIFIVDLPLATVPIVDHECAM